MIQSLRESTQLSKDVQNHIYSFLPLNQFIYALKSNKELWSTLLWRDYKEKSITPYETYREKPYEKDYKNIIKGMVGINPLAWMLNMIHNVKIKEYLTGRFYFVDCRLVEVKLGSKRMEYLDGVSIRDMVKVLFGSGISFYSFYNVGENKGIVLW